MPDRPSWPNWSSIGWISTAFSSVVVARSADIGVEDRHAIDGRPLRSLAIELVVTDGAPRTVGQGADLDCPRGGGFEAIGAERPHQPHDAEASAEALFGMGPALQDQLAERGRRPIEAASRRMRSTVQSAYRRWLDGMCSGTVVCR